MHTMSSNSEYEDGLLQQIKAKLEAKRAGSASAAPRLHSLTAELHRAVQPAEQYIQRTMFHVSGERPRMSTQDW